MRTILLVDDDQMFAYSAARHLTASGYEVITAEGSMDALKVLDSRRAVDFVLADIVMPKGQPNGVSLVRMAKMKRPGIKTALMTGYRDIAGDEGTMPAKLFYKPLDLAALSKAINAMLPGPGRR